MYSIETKGCGLSLKIYYFFSNRSLNMVENFLSDMICLNSVTKSINFLDKMELDDIIEQSLNLSAMLNNTHCTPVPCTPYFKVINCLSFLLIVLRKFFKVF